MGGAIYFSELFFIEKVGTSIQLFSEHVEPLCVVDSSLRIELFFICYGYSIFKTRRGGRNFYPLPFFSNYLTTPTIFLDPLPLFTTLPLLITPYRFPHILTPYLFHGPPTTFDDPLTFSHMLTS